MAGTEIVIRNEGQAWELLASALAGDFDGDEQPKFLRFEGWPTFLLDLDVGEASLRPQVMEGLLAFQESLKRSYALAKYGDRNLTKLPRDEREALEYEIKVRPGSTKLSGDPTEFLSNLVKAMAGKLEAKHWIIIALIVALGYFSNSAWEAYLENRLEMRKVETTSSDTKEMLDGLKFSSEQETQRAELFEKALGAIAGASDIDDVVDEGRRAILKSIPGDATATLPGSASIPGYVAKELARNPRNEARTIIVQGRFAILRVDTTSADGFRVRLKNLNTQEEITAHLREALLGVDERDIIQSAEWAKSPIYAKIDVTRRGGQVIDAVIIKTARTIEGLG